MRRVVPPTDDLALLAIEGRSVDSIEATERLMRGVIQWLGDPALLAEVEMMTGAELADFRGCADGGPPKDESVFDLLAKLVVAETKRRMTSTSGGGGTHRCQRVDAAKDATVQRAVRGEGRSRALPSHP
jgi:hypothetical protein